MIHFIVYCSLILYRCNQCILAGKELHRKTSQNHKCAKEKGHRYAKSHVGAEKHNTKANKVCQILGKLQYLRQTIDLQFQINEGDVSIFTQNYKLWSSTQYL